MFAEIQKIENAARLSMATFHDQDALAAPRPVALAFPVIATLAALVLPCLALFLYL